jgi:serine/threonine-protein kinase
VQTAFNEENAELSPDGRWLAYQSDESGQFEVYVRPFPDVNSGRWPVSTGGGTRPLWARNGRELFYVVTTGAGSAALMRVPIEHRGTFTVGVPSKLFEGRYYFTDGVGIAGEERTYDVSPDGQRFLMIKPEGESEEGPAPVNLVLVLNWLEELKRLVPTN